MICRVIFYMGVLLLRILVPRCYHIRWSKAWGPFACDTRQIMLEWTKSTAAPYAFGPANNYSQSKPRNDVSSLLLELLHVPRQA